MPNIYLHDLAGYSNLTVDSVMYLFHTHPHVTLSFLYHFHLTSSMHFHNCITVLTRRQAFQRKTSNTSSIPFFPQKKNHTLWHILKN